MSRRKTEDRAKPVGAAESRGPDVRQLDGEALAEVRFRPARNRFGFYLDPAVHRQLWEHARSTLEVEVGGVLVGRFCRDADGPFVAIDNSIQAEAAENRAAEMTFTHQTWHVINERMDRDFPERRVVGWYHTHPSFGIFLSDRDVFIQEHFFDGPGQVAFVIDPVRVEEGFFLWSAGKPARAACYWVGAEVKTSREPASEAAARAPARPGSGAERDAAGSATAAPALGDAWAGSLWRGLGMLCLLFIGFALGQFYVASSYQKAVEAEIREVLRSGIFRVGLEDQTHELRRQLRSVEERIARFREASGRGAKSGTNPPDEKPLAEAAEELRQALVRLDELDQTYGRSDAQLKSLLSLVAEKERESAAARDRLPPETAPAETSTSTSKAAAQTQKESDRGADQHRP